MAFDNMLKAHPENGNYEWKNGEEVFEWWLYGTKSKEMEQEETLF